MNIKNKILKSIDDLSHDIDKDMVNCAISNVITIIDRNIIKFDGGFPSACSNNLLYTKTDNHGWTTSFWTGLLWLAYYATDDPKYAAEAQKHTLSFYDRLINKYDFDTHDLGFLYSLSCVSAYKLTGDKFAAQTAVNAADELIKRFKEKGQFIQAWGATDDPAAYRLIIDCMMNLPLLYWCSEYTGDKKYYNIAYAHAQTCMDVIIRDDNSTFHTFYFNPYTGEKEKGVTAQGYSDDSCWSRGQAWAVYGTALTYRYTKDISFMKYNERVCEYFFNHLPDDLIPYWDLIFTDGTEERDSSAAAILACGLYESAKFINDTKLCSLYINTAKAIVNSLTKYYLADNSQESDGILLHSVYSKPGNTGVDESCIWGDYYYFEALLRTLQVL